MLRVGVISDLHIGNARVEVLQPNSTSDRDKFLSKLETLAREKKLSIDVLVIPGDITNAADPEQMRHASQSIKKIADALQVSHDAVFAIPGNHDVDWEILKIGRGATGAPAKAAKALDPLRKLQRYDSLERQSGLLKDIHSRASGRLTEPPYVCSWGFKNVLIVGVNSASHDDAYEPHYGLVSDEQIEAIRLETETAGQGKHFRILLVHHHPVVMTHKHYPELDFSELQNADRLLLRAAQSQFHAIIHGHKHFPRVMPYLAGGTRYMPIIGAGSFSAKIDYPYNDCLGNMFHIVQLEAAAATDAATGHVETWAFSATYGWQESEERIHGLAHRIPFGPQFTRDNLTRALDVAIRTRLATESSITLEELCSIPDLAYIQAIPSSELREIIVEIAKANGWTAMNAAAGFAVVKQPQ